MDILESLSQKGFSCDRKTQNKTLIFWRFFLDQEDFLKRCTTFRKEEIFHTAIETEMTVILIVRDFLGKTWDGGGSHAQDFLRYMD